MGALSKYQSAKSEARATDAQAALYEQSATRQRELTALAETKKRSETSKIQGLQRARLAAAGVAPNTGSALLSQEELSRESELAALMVRSQGNYEAGQLAHQGSLQRWSAKEQRTAASRNLLIGFGEAATMGYGGSTGQGPYARRGTTQLASSGGGSARIPSSGSAYTNRGGGYDGLYANEYDYYGRS